MELSNEKEALQQQYRARFNDSESYRNKLWQLLAGEFFQQYIVANKPVIDVGCGWGEFTNNIQANSKIAMDLNPDSELKLADDVQFLNQSCAARWPLETASLGTVFTSNFLEHLPDKAAVEATLAEARRCIAGDGRLICMGPNVRLVPGAYWDFWDHHVPLSERSLCEVLELQGFEIERCIPWFMPYTMSEGSNPPLFFVWLYLKLPLVWRLLGKQFLVIAKPRG